jgi:Acyl-CoA reductase (LuxC)
MVKSATHGERPVRSIVGAIAAAAARWCDPDFPPRVRALDAVCARTNYSLPVVGCAVDRLFQPMTREAIEGVVGDELGCLDALDRFVQRPGRSPARALPIGRVCIVSSRTTIGVAIVPAIFALCSKSHVLVKDREDQLVGAFFATLAEQLDEFRGTARVQIWNGERDAVDLDAFDAVAAFGADATLARIAARLPPSIRFIAYGSKASAGYLAREALRSDGDARQIAEAAARDLILYDSEGCLSLHVLFVERGGFVSPAEFTAMLAAAIERVAVDFPLGLRAPQTAARLAHARDLAIFRAGESSTVFSDPAASYLVVLDPSIGQPPAFLPRAIGVHSVDAPAQAAAYLGRHSIALEALAVAGRRGDVIEMALQLDVARIARFGELQAPPLGTYHGGRPRIAEFVRWITDEMR